MHCTHTAKKQNKINLSCSSLTYGQATFVGLFVISSVNTCRPGRRLSLSLETGRCASMLSEIVQLLSRVRSSVHGHRMTFILPHIAWPHEKAVKMSQHKTAPLRVTSYIWVREGDRGTGRQTDSGRQTGGKRQTKENKDRQRWKNFSGLKVFTHLRHSYPSPDRTPKAKQTKKAGL